MIICEFLFTQFSLIIQQVAAASYDRQGVADHANNLASKIRGNLTNSLKALGVDILTGFGSILVSHRSSHIKLIHKNLARGNTEK